MPEGSMPPDRRYRSGETSVLHQTVYDAVQSVMIAQAKCPQDCGYKEDMSEFKKDVKESLKEFEHKIKEEFVSLKQDFGEKFSQLNDIAHEQQGELREGDKSFAVVLAELGGQKERLTVVERALMGKRHSPTTALQHKDRKSDGLEPQSLEAQPLVKINPLLRNALVITFVVALSSGAGAWVWSKVEPKSQDPAKVTTQPLPPSPPIPAPTTP